MAVAAVAPAVDDEVEARLRALRALAGEVAAIDLRRGDEDEATAFAHASLLRDILARTVALLAELEARSSAPSAEPDAWTVAVAVPELGDVCFAGALELRRVMRELAAARASEDAVAACETARRKVRRAVRAVLEAAKVGLGLDLLTGMPGTSPFSDLGVALAVRRLYAEFRRALRRPTGDDAEAVLMAVRYAGGALAGLVASPDYAEVRASDRAVLRHLRERALRWARGERNPAAGLQLLEDLWTCGDLLRGINRRQELRAHDAAAIAALRAPGAADDPSSWMLRLSTLEGLDDALDQLIHAVRGATSLHAGPPATMVDAVMTRLGELEVE